MSMPVCRHSDRTEPAVRLAELLSLSHLPKEGDEVRLGDDTFLMREGILRSSLSGSDAQAQTQRTFGFKWAKRDTFESDAAMTRMREWLRARYGAPEAWSWLVEYEAPVLLDAGCGAGMSALALLEPVLSHVSYIGVDVSDAVDIAKCRFSEARQPGAFMQCDLRCLPLPDESIDLIFSEGVLHHTDSTEVALKGLVRLLRPNGRFLFYVYRRKGPIREFTDDYIREQLQDMSASEAWEALMPLTKLGRALGELRSEVDVPEAISLLKIPAGRLDVQRLFYWHVFKAFYHPDLGLEEMNHINFDWYTPRNAHRQTPEDVYQWCCEAGLVIEREIVEEAGITVIARKATDGT